MWATFPYQEERHSLVSNVSVRFTLVSNVSATTETSGRCEQHFHHLASASVNKMNVWGLQTLGKTFACRPSTADTFRPREICLLLSLNRWFMLAKSPLIYLYDHFICTLSPSSFAYRINSGRYSVPAIVCSIKRLCKVEGTQYLSVSLVHSTQNCTPVINSSRRREKLMNFVVNIQEWKDKWV